MLAVTGIGGGVVFGSVSLVHTLTVISSGIVTAVPLLLFAAAARRLPLATIGLTQYLAPVLQFVVGVVLLHEEMPTSRWIGFAIVWVALIVLTTDMVVTSRRSRARGREADRAAALAPDPAGGRDAGPAGDRAAGAESMSRIANETAG